MVRPALRMNLQTLLLNSSDDVVASLDGRLVNPKTLTPLLVTTTSSGLDSCVLPPSEEAAMSRMTEPVFISVIMSVVMRRGGRLPGMSAVVMMMSASDTHRFMQFAFVCK